MKIITVHNTIKVRRFEPYPVGDQKIDLAAAGNQSELGQLVLRADSAQQDIVVTASTLTGPTHEKLPVELFRQHYIHIERTTTPAFEAGWYPDALVPVSEPFDLEANANQSLWIKVRVPDGQVPGAYTGTVSVGQYDIPISLQVWDFSLPVAGHCRTAFAIWYDQLADYYGILRDSHEHWELAEKFYWFQLEYRLPPDDLPISPNLPVQDWLQEAERFLRDPRVIAYRIPARPEDPTWTKGIVEGLRASGLIERGYFYLDEIDEPTAGGIEEPVGGATRVRELCEWLDGIAPEVEHLVTAEPVPELEGAVKVWVPLFDRYDANDARDRARKGERFWWYGCVYPTYPYATYHIDDDLTAARIVPWLMHRDDIEGNLYWATTIYHAWNGEQFVPRDPWVDPLAWPGANGDGQLIYPGDSGPLPSIRLEAIRAGQDDFEYLWLLHDALAAHAITNPQAAEDAESVLSDYRDRIVRSASDFTRVGHEIESVRRAIAEHILRLRGLAVAVTVAGKLPPVRSTPVQPGETVRARFKAEEGQSGIFSRASDGFALVLRTGPVVTEQPWVRWNVDGLLDGDVLEASISSRAQSSTALFVIFIRDDGLRHEAARVMACANESTRISVPIRLSVMEASRITGFELEMMPHQPGADLEIRDVTIVSAGLADA